MLRFAPALLACCVAACSSLAPQIGGSAVDYSTVMEEFSNQVLIVNVLRARDQSPLNFADLPIIHGSIAQQASLGSTVLPGGTAGTSLRNTASAGVQFSSSPTFDTSSLNNEAFMLNMLQPVSPVFIESLWSSGLSRELLLNLFVESIRLPSADADEPAHEFLNNPDAENPRDYADFLRVLHALVSARSKLRSFTVLEPMGPPLMAQEEQAGGKAYLPANLANSRLYASLAQLDPTMFQLGNVSATTTDAQAVAGFQLYRRYHALIGLCVDAQRLRAVAAAMRLPGSLAAAGGVSDPLPGMLEASADDLQTFSMSSAHTAIALYSGRTGGRSHGGASDRSSSDGGVTGLAKPSLATVTQASRITGILDKARECGATEHISPLRPEDDEARDTARFGFIRWRSPMDVYNYLGALARNQDRPERTPAWTETPGGATHTVLRVVPGRPPAAPDQVLASVQYRGATFSMIGKTRATRGAEVVHSMQVLSLLSQLVSLSKISSDIPVTRSFEVLP
ncbi:hypothetical protein [Variovorax sp. OV329]|uniref:hypothetical protein n=1 Tax=Variovorax sp. OV329 TaxID=1882825 RepID=UPI0008E48CED|nr:hypothetical protein [Variovorax sp. OV329]SFM92089.1 hypothetical protein SAMN05444747_11138 [Variovorax sp. OV329]